MRCAHSHISTVIAYRDKTKTCAIVVNLSWIRRPIPQSLLYDVVDKVMFCVVVLEKHLIKSSAITMKDLASTPRLIPGSALNHRG